MGGKLLGKLFILDGGWRDTVDGAAKPFIFKAGLEYLHRVLECDPTVPLKSISDWSTNAHSESGEHFLKSSTGWVEHESDPGVYDSILRCEPHQQPFSLCTD